MTIEVQTDKFDLVIIENDLRRIYFNTEDDEFKLIIKNHNKIMKQYKKEQQYIKISIDEYINKSLMDEQYIINNKRNFLIDSAYEVINEVNACYNFTEKIFNSLPDKRIKKLFNERNKIFKQYHYKIYNNCITDNECLICKDFINRIDLYKCDVCVAMFHNSCINKWLEISKNCPMCKETL